MAGDVPDAEAVVSNNGVRSAEGRAEADADSESVDGVADSAGVPTAVDGTGDGPSDDDDDDDDSGKALEADKRSKRDGRRISCVSFAFPFIRSWGGGSVGGRLRTSFAAGTRGEAPSLASL